MKGYEIKLIEKAKLGDHDAFGEIYKLYFKKLFRFIYYMVNDKALAEDLTQNAFVKIWRNISYYSEKRGKPVTFFFTTAKNLVIDHLRKPKNLTLEEIGEIVSGDDQIERMEKIEAEKNVEKMLAKLESGDKQIILMRYFEDLDYGEIAYILGVKATALRVRVHRILLKLKTKYQNPNIK